MNRNRILLISLGDPNGIGPEVAAKSVGRVAGKNPVVLVGPESAIIPWKHFLRRRMQAVRMEDVPGINPGPGLFLLDPDPGRPVRWTPGAITRPAALAGFRAFECAVRILKENPSRFSLVTAPLSKQACIRAGVPFDGHTGYMGRAFGVRPLMMLVNGLIRVGLVTEHIPLRDVPDRVTADAVHQSLTILAAGLRSLRVSHRPKITVLGLNPHAGEGGRIGTEDQRITLGIRRFNRRSAGVAVGPAPADSAFSHPSSDAFLAMYHDQGLIPVKFRGIDRSVNITLGLPVRRASPAHGTAFDIAGKGLADPRSMRLAIDWAIR